MDHRTRSRALVQEKDYLWSLSQGNSRKPVSSSYFSVESLFLMVCLAASLLLLPLILPPLPPPPLMLLLLPIGIFVVLLGLAVMPGNVRNFTSSYL
ncbi:hypothetical protein FRX31_020458 [Thalictrum thalictroides]|uniref:ARGOS-like protein n=1 Tax=Thalictrum thalictroides TaxID=46969 RepID=A0A7J6VYL3_THATH|nr:hypothetical protein FRX31_020458 [Thalictrum thalictroides]